MFGLISTLLLIGVNTNETFFELSAFISNYVTSNTNLDDKTTLMGHTGSEVSHGFLCMFMAQLIMLKMYSLNAI